MTEKVFIITGANGGLGAAVTERFLSSGARVIGVSRKISSSDFDHANFTAIPAELSSLEHAQSVVTQVTDRFSRLDGLVHLVGAFRGGATVAATEPQTFDSLLQINVISFYLMTAAVMPALQRSGKGRIVCVGSRAAVEPSPGAGAYAASKAALLSLVRTIAVETRGAGITANIVLPGTMDTPANRSAMPNADLSKWVQPSSVADLIFWLCSDQAGEVSGAAIPVYGRDV